MPLYTKQDWYCPVCGKYEHRIFPGKYGGRACGSRCWQEYRWRETLSIMGKEYYPDPRPHDEDTNPGRR